MEFRAVRMARAGWRGLAPLGELKLGTAVQTCWEVPFTKGRICARAGNVERVRGGRPGEDGTGLGSGSGLSRRYLAG
ncbi:hypothetical protein GGTG_09746 [Gaeumannomyces tritici R3-111a-1]|uniref:Uncharacterized protein n=1 Tax=Gaeumannomyces tritici (strain R3-111a-1) TaxID=644352 RepID=J3P8B2_GAET3|nr:hypothetical protein GGTG_09746 [Gaeumannomyces tritici R3-111a-1]EJT72895.1 hypothetical protein GGTG_09746 [Gaeumannomyces tritici R3-111a-1]